MDDGGVARAAPRTSRGAAKASFVGASPPRRARRRRRGSRAAPDRARPSEEPVGVMQEAVAVRAAGCPCCRGSGRARTASAERAERSRSGASLTRGSRRRRSMREAPSRRNPRPPKLPDFSASAQRGSPGVASTARRDRSAGRSRSAATPSACTTAPEVSPPATTSLRTPRATRPCAILPSAVLDELAPRARRRARLDAADLVGVGRRVDQHRPFAEQRRRARRRAPATPRRRLRRARSGSTRNDGRDARALRPPARCVASEQLPARHGGRPDRGAGARHRRARRSGRRRGSAAARPSAMPEPAGDERQVGAALAGDVAGDRRRCASTIAWLHALGRSAREAARGSPPGPCCATGRSGPARPCAASAPPSTRTRLASVIGVSGWSRMPRFRQQHVADEQVAEVDRAAVRAGTPGTRS